MNVTFRVLSPERSTTFTREFDVTDPGLLDLKISEVFKELRTEGLEYANFESIVFIPPHAITLVEAHLNEKKT